MPILFLLSDVGLNLLLPTNFSIGAVPNTADAHQTFSALAASH